jgi:hypothetical protein
MLSPGDSIFPIERRLKQDRRSNRFLGQLSGIIKGGERRRLRRIEDRRKLILLDQYPTPLLVAAIIVMVLSLGDAILTLILISNGAIELNPIMNYLLNTGTTHFIVGKYSLTAGAVFFVLLFNFYPLRGSKIPVRSFLGMFAMIFSAAIAWQIYLITKYVL